MGWDRSRLLVALGATALVVASCGGGGGESTPTTADAGGADTTIASGDEDPDTPTEPVGEEDGGDSGGEPGERSAVISIDGEPTTYDLDDVTFSPIEDVDDLTFETCDPDFFGSGRFYAIGYAVDAEGEVIVGDDGQPGTFTMDLPPDDWEAAQRDAPAFEIKLRDMDIEIASPDEAAGGTMSWTIDDTTASGSAVFVDFENTYTVDFEIVCEGSPTVEVDDLPTDDDADNGGDGGGFPLAGAGVGSFTVDGESFDNVEVYSCEPFSFGSDPNPDDVSVLAYLGGSSGLEVAVSHSEGFEISDGEQVRFDQVDVNVFYSRQGESGLEQFEGSAASNASGGWSFFNQETGEQIDLADSPYERDGDRITGSLAGLEQTWPDEGAATVDVTFDLEIPTEVNEEC